MELFSNT